MSRTDQQLIEALFADTDIAPIRKKSKDYGTAFRKYRVELKREKYRGLPPLWDVGILPSNCAPSTTHEYRKLRNAARKLVSGQDKLTPLLLVSDTGTFRLSNLIRFESEEVFVLDSVDLPSRGQYAPHIRGAPFVRAVRRRLSNTDLSSKLFSAYSPKIPALGWRFFGRRAELDRLINSRESFVVAGGRKVGKTSLLQQLHAELKERRQKSYFVDLQNAIMAPDRIAEMILRSVSAREVYAARKQSEYLGGRLFESALSRISSEKDTPTLILDEFGIIIKHDARGGDWNLVGTLRKFCHSGKLRVVMSGFQEYFIKQVREFDGPFVNFATPMRLRGFSRSEVRELLIDPLSAWANVSDRTALLDLVIQNCGGHPLLLTTFGAAVFSRLTKRRVGDVVKVARRLVDGSDLSWLEEVVEEIFWTESSPTVRFLFLSKCLEEERSCGNLRGAVIDDSWVQGRLGSIRQESTFDGRRLALTALEIRGLTEGEDGPGFKQIVKAPIIFRYLRETQGKYLEDLIKTLGSEVHLESDRLTVRGTI